MRAAYKSTGSEICSCLRSPAVSYSKIFHGFQVCVGWMLRWFPTIFYTESYKLMCRVWSCVFLLAPFGKTRKPISQRVRSKNLGTPSTISLYNFFFGATKTQQQQTHAKENMKIEVDIWTQTVLVSIRKLPYLKVTVCPWKSVVGRLNFWKVSWLHPFLTGFSPHLSIRKLRHDWWNSDSECCQKFWAPYPQRFPRITVEAKWWKMWMESVASGWDGGEGRKWMESRILLYKTFWQKGWNPRSSKRIKTDGNTAHKKTVGWNICVIYWSRDDPRISAQRPVHEILPTYF